MAVCWSCMKESTMTQHMDQNRLTKEEDSGCEYEGSVLLKEGIGLSATVMVAFCSVCDYVSHRCQAPDGSFALHCLMQVVAHFSTSRHCGCWILLNVRKRRHRRLGQLSTSKSNCNAIHMRRRVWKHMKVFQRSTPQPRACTFHASSICELAASSRGCVSLRCVVLQRKAGSCAMKAGTVHCSFFGYCKARPFVPSKKRDCLTDPAGHLHQLRCVVGHWGFYLVPFKQVSRLAAKMGPPVYPRN
eukprot:1202898-Amphidinium_carterae.2